jgi:hypothetical protein
MKAWVRRAGMAMCVCSVSALVGPMVGACSSSSGGTGDGGLYTSDRNSSSGCTKGDLITDDKGHSLKSFCAPSDPGPNAIYVSASGETLSLVGFEYPPAPAPDDTWMVDGWRFTLEAYITVFTAVTLWTDPDESPGNQSLHGPQVAQLNGPWVVDLHKGGALPGQAGMGEQATPIGVLPASEVGSACSSAPCGFGFSTVPAPADYDAFNVNLDATENAYYAYMVQNGYSVLYVGTATWAGTTAWSSEFDECTMTKPECSVTKTTPSEPFDFVTSAGYPATMSFMMGFSTPTNYVNCQNGSEFPGQMGIGGEDHPRGIQTKSTGSVPAQVTIHMDHPFWESFAENSPLHWDNIASQYIGKPMPVTVHTEDMKGVDFTAFADNKGDPVPVRNCSSTCYTPMAGNQLHYDPLTVPVCIGNTAEAAAGKCLASYFDFIRFSQSTQGHLNSQGFCFIDRQYPSPGGSSAGITRGWGHPL